MKIRVYIRAETILVLMHKRGWTQRQLALALQLSESQVHRLIQAEHAVKGPLETRLLDLFRGMSHKPGGRVSWHDMFEPREVGTGASC